MIVQVVAWEPFANVLASAVASCPDAASTPFQLKCVVSLNNTGRDGPELKFDHASIAVASPLSPEFEASGCVIISFYLFQLLVASV